MRPVRRADNLTTFMCRLSRKLTASTSCNPKGLSRPVMGLLYLFTKKDVSIIQGERKIPVHPCKNGAALYWKKDQPPINATCRCMI
jgi:hypothetical protein